MLVVLVVLVSWLSVTGCRLSLRRTSKTCVVAETTAAAAAAAAAAAVVVAFVVVVDRCVVSLVLLLSLAHCNCIRSLERLISTGCFVVR